jgi:hypothetical protein
MKRHTGSGTVRNKFFPSALAAVLFYCLSSTAAQAQCEVSASADPALSLLASQDISNLNDYNTEEQSFVDEKLTQTATYEISARLQEYDVNIRRQLTRLWHDQMEPAFKLHIKQLATSQVAQTLDMGQMIDAHVQNETMEAKKVRKLEAERRYRPAESACQIDTQGPGQTKSYQMSRALTRGFAQDDSPRRGNDTGSISEGGKPAEVRDLWAEYVTYFCDNTKGDQGCTTPGSRAGQQKNLPGFLWGDKQTIDMADQDNRVAVAGSLRYLIYPFSNDLIPQTAIRGMSGHYQILARRSEETRSNAAYNVVGQMLAERAGGSGVNTQTMRTKAGIPATDAATDASYREVQEAMGRNRFYDPEYIVRLVEDPEQVVREQGALKAIQLQTMNDIYHRNEDALFMEAALYARDLDKKTPGTGTNAAPLQ